MPGLGVVRLIPQRESALPECVLNQPCGTVEPMITRTPLSRRLLPIAALILPLLSVHPDAEAKGCVKGAVVGGVVGHVAGGHVLTLTWN